MDRLLQLQLVFNTLLVVFNQLPLIQGHRLHRRGQDLGMQARGAAEQQSSCHSDGRGSLLYLNRCKVCHSASRWSQHTGCDRPPKNTNLPGGTLLAVKGFTPAEDHHVCVCVAQKVCGHHGEHTPDYSTRPEARRARVCVGSETNTRPFASNLQPHLGRTG